MYFLTLPELKHDLSLSGTDAGCEFIAGNDKYLTAIIGIAEDQSQLVIMKDALFALINLTTHAHIAQKIATLSSKPDLIMTLLKWVLKADFKYGDIVSSILANMSRDEECAKLIVKQILANQDSVGFDKLITVFCTIDYNKENKLHYLGSVLSNLTQIQETRQYILDKKRCVVQRLLPFTEYKESVIRRAGAVATLKNCSFETGMKLNSVKKRNQTYIIMTSHIKLVKCNSTNYGKKDVNDQICIFLD